MITRAMAALFPYFAQGKVIRGFGRGSKQLGIPTANFPDSVVDSLPKEFESGIYFGWANINDGPVYKMVMSIGWNPFYHNQKRSMETHVMHKFPEDFYGATMKVCICGYIRPERNFDSVDELIKTIRADIEEAEEKLNTTPYEQHRDSGYFQVSPHL